MLTHGAIVLQFKVVLAAEVLRARLCRVTAGNFSKVKLIFYLYERYCLLLQQPEHGGGKNAVLIKTN